MKKDLKYKKLICSIFALIMIFSSVNGVLAGDVIPVIDILEDKDTFDTYSYPYDDYDYYVTHPEDDGLSADVLYTGEDTDFYYTSAGADAFSASSYGVVNKDTMMPKVLTSGSSRTDSQPFIEDTDDYPRAVRTLTGNEPSFEKTMRTPYSLHKDYSFTFLAEVDEYYYFFIDGSMGGFYLDIEVYDCDAYGDVYSSSYPYHYDIDYKYYTYVFFPMISSHSQNISLIFESTTLVTVTPHEIKQKVVHIPENSTYSEEVIQGSLDPEEKDYDLVTNKSNIFSMYLFNLTLVEGEYYEIYVDIIDYLDIEDCTADILLLLFGYSYEHIEGDLDEGGVLIKATESMDVSLVLSIGSVVDLRFSIFFRKVSPPEIEEIVEEPLQFGQNFEMVIDTYYTFTLSTPSMMAINITNDIFNANMDFYRAGDEGDPWDHITNENEFNLGGNLEEGNLIGDTPTDIDTNWVYIPAGNYSVKSDDPDLPGEEIHFTVVPIVTVSSSTTQAINENSIVAIEFQLTKHRINYINISTDDHVNQSVIYEYAVINKYDESNGIAASATNTLWMGNEDSNNDGSWEEYNSNNSRLRTYIPLRDHDVPIILIHPYQGWNITDQIYDFTQNLRISTNLPANQNLATSISYIGPTTLQYLGDGDFIPISSSVISSVDININDAYSASQNHVYAIPLNVDPYSIYNVSLRIIGNYNPTTCNASFDTSPYAAVYSHDKNLLDTSIFGTRVIANGGRQNNATLLLLTATSSPYLCVDIIRIISGGYLNATLSITLSKLAVPHFELDVIDLDDYSWNETRHDDEVKNKHLLIELLNPPSSAPGFELITAGGALVVFATLFARKRRK